MRPAPRRLQPSRGGHARRRVRGGRQPGRRHPGGRVGLQSAVGEQRGARRDVELRLRRGDDGRAQPLRQLLGDQRNVGAAADGRDRG